LDYGTQTIRYVLHVAADNLPLAGQPLGLSKSIAWPKIGYARNQGESRGGSMESMIPISWDGDILTMHNDHIQFFLNSVLLLSPLISRSLISNDHDVDG
jgi:hypothetical protein